MLLVAVVYWPVYDHDFVNYDDYQFVVDNVVVRAGLTGEGIRWAFSNAYAATGGPLTWLSHMLDIEWFGVWAGGHHISNVVLHGMATVLAFLALHALTGGLWRSAVVAALFAIHPLHVESVAWVAERKDVLSAVFWFAAIVAYTRYVAAPSAGRYVVVFVAFVLGLMSKPMVATLPFVLLLLDVWPLRRVSGEQATRIGRLILEKAPFVVAAAIALWMTLGAQTALGAVTGVQSIPPSARLENAAVSYVAYLWKALWPAGLIPYYPFRVAIPWWLTTGCLALLVALSVLVVRIRHVAPAAAMGWCWYLGTLVPVIGLVQVGGHAMADRFTYLPLVGVFIAIVWPVSSWIERRRIAPRVVAAVVAALIGAHAFVAFRQVGHWRDGVALWSHTIRVDPANARAHANLGDVLITLQRHREAVPVLREAIRLHPDVPHAHSNLGLALEATGNPSDAIIHFREAARLNPSYLTPRTHLANLLAQRGDTDEALVHYNDALRLAPTNVLIHTNLAVTLARAGRPGDGLPHILEAIRLDPASAEWRFFAAAILLDLGKLAEARAHLVEALSLDPSHAGARRLLASLPPGGDD